MAVHGAGNNGQADTKVISSKPDTNTGSTYDEYLNEISQNLNKCKERGPPLNENIAKLFQKLVYNEKLPPGNINRLEANKVNFEIWGQIAHQTKSFDLKLQNLQKLILESLSVLSKTANTLYKHRSEKNLTKLAALVKATIKSFVDTAVFLDKANEKILTYRREKIKPELNQNYRHISVEKCEHPKLLFGDDLPKILKDMAEANKVGKSLTQRPLPSSSTMRFQNSFLYKSQGYPQIGHQPRQHPYQLQRSQRFSSPRFNKSMTMPPKPHH